MLFNSNAFYVFLPIVFAIYWLTPPKHRWGVLLVSSYYFYMSANASYIFLILLTTAVSYTTALILEKTENPKKRKLCIWTALVVCLGLLFFFKYFNFLSKSLVSLLKSVSISMSPVTLNLVLPVGISFYTFQTLGYVIDVYKGRTKACRHFGKYAAFVSFFPLLLAGPIERAEHLMPQMEEEHSFDCDKAIRGAKLIAWGYFKKIAIADVLSSSVDIVYNQVTNFTGLALGVATFFYAFQVYCDFSGYSDIARGVACLFDIDLVNNFKSPYFAASIKEFWGRWHISLSTWFRDYVYIPLGGSRAGTWKTYRNLIITFLISGLWHGANWTFVVWGGLHGLYNVVSRLTKPLRLAVNRLTRLNRCKKLHHFLQRAMTFCMVAFAWIFFRADTLSDAWYVISHMFRNCQYFLPYLREGYDFLGLTKLKLLGLLLPVALLAVFDYFSLKMDVIDRIGQWKTWQRWLLYVAFVSVTICMVAASYGNVSQEFIYFQF